MAQWTMFLEMLFWVTVGLSLLGVVFLPILVIFIPADHFSVPSRQRPQIGPKNTGRHLAFVVVRNLLAAPLFLAGVIMLFTPGQGVVMVLVALLIATFPGKDRVERWIIALPGVLAALNKIREKAGRSPLGKPLGNDQEKT